jgi:hypothetical protein
VSASCDAGLPFVVSEFMGEDGSPRIVRHDASAAEWGRSVVRRLRACVSISGDFTMERLRSVLLYLGNQSLDLLEEFLGIFVTKFMTDAALRARSPDLAKALVGVMTSLPSRNVGPIVDYIEPLLPDISTDELLPLIFSRKPTDGPTTRNVFYDQCVPHLMSVLLHEASWGELQYIIAWILQKDRALQVQPLSLSSLPPSPLLSLLFPVYLLPLFFISPLPLLLFINFVYS